jgi:subtilisin-like proprotein convertase family protein
VKSRRSKFLVRSHVQFDALEPRQLLAGGTISGVAWNDLNNNGARDTGEPALPNWTIYLDANHNGRLDAGETSTLTGSNGSYAFTNLAAENYLVGQVTRPGWQQTSPAVSAASPAMAMPASSTTTSDVVLGAIRRSADLSTYTAAELAKARQWVVAPSGKTTIGSIVSKLGAKAAAPTGLLPNTYVVTFPAGVSGAKAAGRLRGAAGLSWFYPLVSRQQQLRSAAPNDPMFSQQWHLKNSSVAGADLDVLPAWDLATGSGVTVGIVDDGVQYTHPDLAANYDAADSYDFTNHDNNPAPDASNGDFHGTEVAGVLAAVANNGIGVAGVAPQVKFAGLRMADEQTTDIEESSALSYHRNAISIYSNSWGPYDDGLTLEGPGPQTLAAFGQSVTQGRGGLGNVYVWAAGNGLENGDNVNYDGYANSRYVIAATALNNLGKQAYYAEPGAPIFVSAFGGDTTPGIATTDLVGSQGDNSSSGTAGDYLNYFGGTSASAPEVSGVVALMLQANPGLTWRDVKHILADTAVKNDPTDAGWVLNGAGHWVNHKYGFGQVDAAAAVRAAIGWTNVSPEQQVTSGTVTVGKNIPNNNASTGVTSSVTINSLLRVETVAVVFDATTAVGDLRVVLTSPDGTQAVLATPHADTTNKFTSWTFSSTHDWDEIAKGTWTIRVTDEKSGNAGMFNSWKLNLYGTPVVGENYVSLAAGASVAGQDFGNRPLPGARVGSANFPKQGGAQRLVFGFDQDVSGSISADDLELTNLTTGQVVPTAATKLTYNPGTRTATWAFPGLTRSILADGDYAARLKAAQITLPNGGMLDANGDGMGGDDFVFNFSFLQGDANGDRKVSGADSDILFANLNKTGASFDQGDFNYDGKVSFGDYQILEVAFGHSLPGAAPAADANSVIYDPAAAAPVVASSQPSGAVTTTSVKGVFRPKAVNKPVTARPMVVVPPAMFGVRPLGRRNMDLLDAPPKLW